MSFKDKIDLLPDVSSMYHEKLDYKGKFQKYEHILNDEIDHLLNHPNVLSARTTYFLAINPNT